MRLFLLVALYLSPVYGDYTDEWIDPSDMLNYDAASGKMKNKPQVESTQSYYSVENTVSQDATQQPAQKANELHQNPDMTCSAEYQEYKTKLENLKGQLEETKRMEKSKSKSQAIFKRYLNKILIEAGRIGLPDESYPKAQYDAEVVLTMEMLQEIQSFLNNGDWNVGALDDALSSTLVQFKHHNEEEWKWKFEDSFGVDVYTLFMLILCVLCLVKLIATEIWTHIGWFTQLKRLLILSIVISFGWNWMYLYKVAFAERQAELAKLQDFDKCSQKISWSESLFDWMKGAATFQNDPCEDYFKALIVSPTLMVPPTKALALTFTNFITEPLKHIGKGIGEFLNALLSEIPLFFQVPVLIFIAVLLLAFFYGAGTAVMNPVNHFRRLTGSERERTLHVEPARPVQNAFIEDVYASPLQGGSHDQLPPGERGRDNNLPGPERERPLPVEPARSNRKRFIEDVCVPPPQGGYKNQLPRDNDVVNIPKQQPLDDIDGSNNPPVTAPADPSDTGQVKCNNTGEPLVQEDHSIKKSIKESRNDERPNTESPEAEPQRPEEPVVETLRST
uniref:Chloride channel CLIC-like protein 1 n=1 Tax=Xenopus laevis TaxID=8355 RepID=B7ZR83_XENLA|nr:LOC397947 protein [Xenopus laevis]